MSKFEEISYNFGGDKFARSLNYRLTRTEGISANNNIGVTKRAEAFSTEVSFTKAAHTIFSHVAHSTLTGSLSGSAICLDLADKGVPLLALFKGFVVYHNSGIIDGFIAGSSLLATMVGFASLAGAGAGAIFGATKGLRKGIKVAHRKRYLRTKIVYPTAKPQ